jgi:D-3-phosphoglycerate dehydrogenase
LKKKHNILIIDEVHPVLIEKLGDFNITYRPDITLSDLKTALSGVSILVVRSKLIIDRTWIDRAESLQYIGRLGSGMDNIDVSYAESKGIVCENAPEGNRNAVAEQTVGMLLSMLANINKAANEVRGGVWDRKGNQGVELQNLTVGIIGYGNVGSTLAQKLSSFGCKILAYDRFISDYGNDKVKEVSLEELQNESDVISLHVPLNETSKEMVNSSFILNVSKSFYLLNLSRGEVVNIPDIIYALKNGKIKGAGLDVLPNEKLENLSEKEKNELSYMSGNERVILTPHIGGLTADSYKSLANVLAEKILKWS